jgi:hypothetical protein
MEHADRGNRRYLVVTSHSVGAMPIPGAADFEQTLNQNAKLGGMETLNRGPGLVGFAATTHCPRCTVFRFNCAAVATACCSLHY